MTLTVKFDQKSFKKGVNDALTLAPLRQVFRAVTLQHSGTVVINKPRSENTGRDVKHGNPNTSRNK